MRVLKREPQAKFSGLFDSILGAAGLGLQTAGQLGLLTPKPPKPTGCTMVNVYTQGEVAACLDSFFVEFNKTAGMPAQDRLQLAQRIRAVLDDTKVFRNPLGSAEATTYLNNTKKAFDASVAVLQAEVASGNNTATATGAGGVITAGTPVAQAPVASVAGLTISQNTLVYGGIGLLALVVILSRK